MTAEIQRTAGRWPLRLVLVVLAFLTVMPAASPAAADAAQNQAASEVAASRCAKVRADLKIPRPFGQVCESRLVDALQKGAEATAEEVERVCEWLPDLPLVGDVCDRVRRLMAGIAQEYQQRLAALRGAVDFAKDPWGQTLSKVADSLGGSLNDLLTRVVTHLAHLSSPDVDSQAFLQSYAAGAGIAMFVLVAALARAFYKAGSGDITGEELADSVFRRLPWAMVLVLFGPGIGYLLVELSNGATASIMRYFATDVASLASKLNAMAVPANMGMIPGGPLVSILIVLVAMMGAFALLVGLLMQLLTLYLTGAVMAVAFVLIVDPSTRQQAMKLPLLWLALLGGRPLVFFMLGVTAKYGDSSFSVSAVQDEGFRALVSALVAALMLLFVGIAPWAVLRFAPVLPAGGAERIARSQKSSGGAFGGTAGSLMTHLAYRRMSSGAASSDADRSPPAGGQPQGDAAPTAARDASANPEGAPERGGDDPQHDAGRSQETPAPDGSGSPQPGSPSTTASAASTNPAGAGSGGTAGGSAGGAAAGAGAGGSAGGAGTAAGGAGAAAGAGATAATGGVAAVAVIGAQAAAAAKQKVDESAHRAGDMVEGSG
ncbi:proline-rich domain-containing protein [Micromonospora sp. NPDC048063]|uniref:proline-rich domain-containing protein n=1 Tax=Micromonospora sp. NPDC048063 TaxID=3364256 RepID=UPI003714791D